jgi:hypothetical protein
MRVRVERKGEPWRRIARLTGGGRLREARRALYAAEIAAKHPQTTVEQPAKEHERPAEVKEARDDQSRFEHQRFTSKL